MRGQKCAGARGSPKCCALNGMPHLQISPLRSYFLQGKYDPAVSQQPSISFEFYSRSHARSSRVQFHFTFVWIFRANFFSAVLCGFFFGVFTILSAYFRLLVRYVDMSGNRSRAVNGAAKRFW